MLTVTELITEFGNHYVNESQNESNLLHQIRQRSITTSYAKHLIIDGTIHRFSNVILNEIVQQFQSNFTPKGNLEFKPNEIRLNNLKIDLEINPDKLTSTYAGFLSDINEGDRTKWPIVKYLLEKHMVPEMRSQLETKAYFKGVYVAPTIGTAGTTAGSMDGIKKKLDAGVLDNTMESVALSSVITATTAFDMVEEFVESFDASLEGVKMVIYMPPKVLKWYHQDKRNTHGSDVNYDPKKPTVDFTEYKLVALPSMAGTNYIWATPEENYLYLRRKNGMNKPVIQPSDRNIKIMLDWWEGIGFGYNELVYVHTWITPVA